MQVPCIQRAHHSVDDESHCGQSGDHIYWFSSDEKILPDFFFSYYTEREIITENNFLHSQWRGVKRDLSSLERADIGNGKVC